MKVWFLRPEYPSAGLLGKLAFDLPTGHHMAPASDPAIYVFSTGE